MGHWAKIDDDNLVTQVVVADDDKQDWLTDNLGGTWVQTSYNTRRNEHKLGGTPLRGNFAGIGYTYLEAEDIFMPPKPFESWVLDVECACWVAPVDMPDDDKEYSWDEDSTSWVEIVEAV